MKSVNKEGRKEDGRLISRIEKWPKENSVIPTGMCHAGVSIYPRVFLSKVAH